MRNVTRSLGTAVVLLLALASSVNIGHSAAAVAGTQNPVPLVNNPLVPDSTAPGGSDFTLTVNGTGFVSGSVVQWNGIALATTFVSGSQLTAIVPATDTATPGTASVLVTNPSPGGGISYAVIFDVRVPFRSISLDQNIIGVGPGPAWVVSADMNGDNEPDLVTSLNLLHAVAVSLGNGDGTFQQSIVHRIDTTPDGVVVADFNHDGKLDVAVTDTPGFVIALLGNGDGTLRDPQKFSLGTEGVTLAAKDFNGDGNSDLAVALGSGTASVLLGNGDGTFQSAKEYDAGSTRGSGIVIGDFNEDGKLDLALTVFDGAIAILLGNGDGTFQPPLHTSSNGGAMSLVAGDFNNDGHLDSAAQSAYGVVSVLLGRGDGTFLPNVDYEIQPTVYGLATADLNGDGFLDLTVPAYQPGRIVSVLLGKGDGTFFHRSDFPTEAKSTPVTIAVGDFNGDGMIDLATANAGEQTLTILPQLTSVLSRTYLKFGNLRVGERSTRNVTLTNIGRKSVKVSKIALVGKDESGYSETNDCGPNVVPGASCKITIVFKPLSATPYRHARIKVSNRTAIYPQKIYLVGRGTNYKTSAPLCKSLRSDFPSTASEAVPKIGNLPRKATSSCLPKRNPKDLRFST